MVGPALRFRANRSAAASIAVRFVPTRTVVVPRKAGSSGFGVSAGCRPRLRQGVDAPGRGPRNRCRTARRPRSRPHTSSGQGKRAGGDHGRVVAGDIRQEQYPCDRGLCRPGQQPPLDLGEMLAHRVERCDVGTRPQEETERFRLLFQRDPCDRRGQHGGTAARHKADHEVPFPGVFQKRQDLARRREAEDVGDRVPGRRELHRARLPFRAARHDDHPARDAFPHRREGRLPHRPSRLSGPDEVYPPEGR